MVAELVVSPLPFRILINKNKEGVRMLARRGRGLAAAVVAAAAMAVVPASALAATGSVSASANPGGSLGCAVVNLPPGTKAQTIKIAYSAATAAAIDKLLAQLGVKAQLPAGAGVVTISVTPGGTCASAS